MDTAVRVINAGVMVAGPVVLGAILARRLKLSWKLFAAGAGTFLLSQLLHLPFNSFLLLPGLELSGVDPSGAAGMQLVYSLAVGLSAGLFEEVARYLVLRFGMKSARSWREALMFGAGHGGVEAILVGGLAIVALLQVLAYSSPDGLASLPADQQQLAANQIEAYWAVPWYEAMLGAVERVFAVCFHLSAAVLVMEALRRRNVWWLALAVGWHTLLDASVVFVVLRWNVYASEAVLAVLAAASLWIVFSLRSQGDGFDAGQGDDPGGGAKGAGEREPGVESFIPAAIRSRDMENLEDSRFHGG